MAVSDTVLVAGITAIAGLGSAWIGGRTANRRAAETFTHERRLRDEDLVRAAVDNSLNASEEELSLIMEIHAYLAAGVRDDANAERIERAAALESDLAQRIRQVMLRLHRQDQIVGALESYRKKLFATRTWLAGLHEKETTPDQAQWKTSLNELADCYAAVLDATANRLESTIADDTTVPSA
jgi:hypothetical protein